LINTTAREEHALWLSKNMIQKRIFGIKKVDVSTIGGRREFQH
jgi:hypothetical protein